MVIIVLRKYRVSDSQDPVSQRHFVTDTKIMAYFEATKLKGKMNVVPLDLGYFIKYNQQQPGGKKWIRAHYEHWETGKYKGKLVYTP